MMLLAKKCLPGKDSVSLEKHTAHVCLASDTLFGTIDHPTRLGKQWLRFFRLDPATDFLAFVNNLLAACLFHDWGKANQDMQDLLHGKTLGHAQLFRHEHLSVLLLACPGVDSWIRQRSDIDWDIVLAAIGSHHLKFGEVDFENAPPDRFTQLLIRDDDFQLKLLPTISSRLDLKGHPVFPPELCWGDYADAHVFNPHALREKLQRERLRRFESGPRDSDQCHRARMLSAVRSALIVADAAGSGLPRRGQAIDRWLRQRFGETDLCDFDFVQDVITKRVEQLVLAGKWKGNASWTSKGWNEFQLQCDTLPSRALLLAPCGAGKTLAAWRWIAAQVKQRPVKRVLFLYPTRATATEGFKDYVSWAPEADASLMHGTADYDLDDMFPVEDPRGKQVFNETDPRLFALRHWSKRVFSATVDQFLAFMNYGYGPICLLPVLADSVIVVDEVHSFDRPMFSALLHFLESFDVPVLCMTATLQSGRIKQLTEVVEKVYEDRPGELTELSDAARYKIRDIAEYEAEQKARDAVAKQQRVLWVVNRVKQAQEIACKLADIGVPLICYHSRFKLDDRVQRHRETVAAIRAGQGPAVVISTQVCEMSLDIDADVLITEACPISSLIQRMGRCRRGRDELTRKGPGEVFVYRPASELVYSQDDLFGLEKFLTNVSGKDAASQTDLEKGLEEFGSKTVQAAKLCSFLTSGAYASAQEDSFRDIDAFNFPAVLRGEIADYLASNKSLQPGFVVPVPRKLSPPSDDRLAGYLRVGDERHYDAKTGYWDVPFC